MQTVTMLKITMSIAMIGLLAGCGGGTANHVPLGVNDTWTVSENAAASTFDVLANDNDEDHDTLTIQSDSVTTPNHGGTAVIAANKITYTPETGYHGTETFRYTVTDGKGGEANATVTVTIVNAAPVAHDDMLATARGADAVNLDVLANDTDAEHDTLTIKAGSLTIPTHGGTAVIAANTITYTPPDDYRGTETFDYTVTDGNGGEATATVTFRINSSSANIVAIYSFRTR